MAASEIPLHSRIRENRLELKWSQARLAGRVDCSQSAVSLLEQGRYDVLADEKIRAICEELGIRAGLPAKRDAGAPPLVLKFCPNAFCLLNIPYNVGAKTCYRPTLYKADQGTLTFCPECGDILSEECECGAPVVETAFCPECGAPRVPAGHNLTDEEIVHRITVQKQMPALTTTRIYRHIRRKDHADAGEAREAASSATREHVEVG